MSRLKKYIPSNRYLAMLIALLLSMVKVVADTLPIEQRIAPMPDLFGRFSTQELEQKGNDYLLRRHEPDSASLCFNAIVQRYNNHQLQTDDELRNVISALNGLEYLHIYYYQDYRRAIAYIIESQHIAEHIGADDRLPEIYIAIGDLHATLFNISAASTADTLCARQAIDYFCRAYALSSEQQKWPQSVVAMIDLLHIASSFDALDEVDTDIQHFSQAQIPDSVTLCRYARLLCKAMMAKKQGDYEAALAFYDAMPTTIDTDQARGRCQLLIDLDRADIYEHTGQTELQFKCYRDLLPWAQENDVKEIITDAYRVFAEYYTQSGDTHEAERYQLLYLQQKDSLLNERHAADIGYIKVLADWKESEAEIVSWTRLSKLQHRVAWIAGLIALVFLLICVWLLWRYRKLHHRYHTLYNQNLQLLSDIEAERERLAAMEYAATHEEETATMTEAPAEASPSPNHNLQIRIRQVLELDSEIFSPDFSVRRLAEIVGEKYWTVSQVINEEWGKNFNTVLAEYRILEACRRINDVENYGNLTIEAIAQSVGIRSRSNFSNTFKQIVGMPPSEYQKMARQ